MATAGKSAKPKKQVTAGPPTVKVSLQALFTLATSSQQRWTPTQSISGATVAIKGTTVSVVSNANGEVSLPVSTLAGKGRVLEITAATNQSSTGPAGPTTSTANFATEPRFRLRPFEVTVDCLAAGFDITVAPKISYTTVPDVPAHALMVKFEQQLLRLDWKPDWIKTANRNVTPAKVNRFLVLHQTSASESIGSHINTFTNPQSGVGIHYLVDVDGHVVKLVHEGDGVNHTGASFWLGTRGLNGRSIGIEIVHDDSGGVHAFPAAQLTAVVRLVREIRAAFPTITRQNVVGHSDIEVVSGADATIGTRRQNDPGEAFEWEQLEGAAMARQQLLGPNPATVYGLTVGQSLTPRSPPSPHISAAQTDLSAIGYSVANNGTNISGVYDLALERAVARFQMRYLSGGRRALRPPRFRLGDLDFVTATIIRSVVADNGP